MNGDVFLYSQIPNWEYFLTGPLYYYPVLTNNNNYLHKAHEQYLHINTHIYIKQCLYKDIFMYKVLPNKRRNSFYSYIRLEKYFILIKLSHIL